MGKSYRTLWRKVYPKYYHRSFLLIMDTNIKNEESNQEKNYKKKKSKNLWALKVFIIAFVLSGLFSFLSDVIITDSSLWTVIVLIAVFIIIGILTDCLAVAVTSCDIAPLTAMASKRVKGAKTALSMVKNAAVVSSICADVIGDICGIISGACSVTVVAKLLIECASFSEVWTTLIVGSLIASLTIGGKAFFKTIAIKYSKEIVMFTSKIVSVFVKEK